MTELDPRIRAIAEHYDFDITWCEEWEPSQWAITSKCKGFWWSDQWASNSNDPFGSFLDEVREFFFDKGLDAGCNGYL